MRLLKATVLLVAAVIALKYSVLPATPLFDDFDGSFLPCDSPEYYCGPSDNGSWQRVHSFLPGLNCSFEPEHAWMESGFLVLRVPDGDIYGNEGGEIDSARSDFTYGTYRARMRAPLVCGSVVGFFWYLDGHGEIDVEILFDDDDGHQKVFFPVHDLAGSIDYDGIEPFVPPSPDWFEDFHVYEFHWSDEGYIEYYIDYDYDHSIYDAESPVERWRWSGWTPSQPGSLILNHWTGANPNWGGGPPSVDVFVEVDWVSYTPSGNANPMLLWVGEAGTSFYSDGLDPEEGTTATTFEWRIKYQDDDGDSPESGYPKLHVWDMESRPVAGSPFPMSPLDGNPYQDGRVYGYTRQLPQGSYQYWFDARDIHGAEASTVVKQGPTVSGPPNTSPTISLKLPENGYTEAEPPVTLKWTVEDPDNDELSYSVYLEAGDPDPDVLVDSGTATATNFTYEVNHSVAYGTTYWWKVEVDDGTETVASEVRSFTTIGCSACTPSLIAPTPSGVGDVPVDVTMRWSCNGGAGVDNYRFYFGTSSPPPLIGGVGVSTQYTPAEPLNCDTDYYWRIEAQYDGCGAILGPVWQYTTEAGGNTSPTISLQLPNDGYRNAEPPVTLKWTVEDPDNDELSYSVYLEAGDADPDVLVDSGTTTATSFTYEENHSVAYGTTYWWKVEVDDGTETVASEVRSFTTIGCSAPSISLQLPDNGYTEAEPPVTLKWTAEDPDDDELSYSVYLEAGDTDPDVLVDSGTATATSFTYEENHSVAYGTTYWWKVEVDDGTETAASEVRSFTTVSRTTPAVFRVEHSGSVLADGTLFAAGLKAGAADIAEWVSVSGPAAPAEVLELDVGNPGAYKRSDSPCSQLVAGVVSATPGVRLGRDFAEERNVLLALVGIIQVKVTNERGPIQPGDLLVTSSTPGRAMRWAGLDSCPCALVGKALEPMTDESGIILVLLTAH